MMLEITPREAKAIREALCYAWIHGAHTGKLMPIDYRTAVKRLAPRLYEIERAK